MDDENSWAKRFEEPQEEEDPHPDADRYILPRGQDSGSILSG